jgi:hypothetical protein
MLATNTMPHASAHNTQQSPPARPPHKDQTLHSPMVSRSAGTTNAQRPRSQADQHATANANDTSQQATKRPKGALREQSRASAIADPRHSTAEQRPSATRRKTVRLDLDKNVTHTYTPAQSPSASQSGSDNRAAPARLSISALFAASATSAPSASQGAPDRASPAAPPLSSTAATPTAQGNQGPGQASPSPPPAIAHTCSSRNRAQAHSIHQTNHGTGGRIHSPGTNRICPQAHSGAGASTSSAIDRHRAWTAARYVMQQLHTPLPLPTAPPRRARHAAPAPRAPPPRVIPLVDLEEDPAPALPPASRPPAATPAATRQTHQQRLARANPSLSSTQHAGSSNRPSPSPARVASATERRMPGTIAIQF